MLLVTGITGHTGRYFLKHLIENNYVGKIRFAIRHTSSKELFNNLNLNFELAIGNLNDPLYINEIMKGVKTVFHIYNIHHSIEIIKAALKNNVQRAILVHTTGIYSQFKNASSEYQRIESDVLSMADGKIDLTILRPTMIYGDMCDRNMSKFIKMIDKMKIYPLIAGGRSLIQPVNARDLGKAYYQVLMNPEVTRNKCYNLSGERPISIQEALTLICKYLNKKTIFIPIPLKLSVFAAYILKYLSFCKFDIIEKVQRMGEDRVFDHSLAAEDFGYSPMNFEEGIKLQIDEYLKKKAGL